MCVVPAVAPAMDESSTPSAFSAHSKVAEGRISSKFRGLCWDKKHCAWRVRIFYCGKQRHVGRYKDDVTAARAYDKAAVYLYGSKAILNFTMEDCVKDPSEVSGFITLAKEQAQQQQQQSYLTKPRADNVLLPSSGTCYPHAGTKDDVYQQLPLLAAQHATLPIDGALPQQHLSLQAASSHSPMLQQQWPNPVLQQPQPTYQAAHMDSNSRMLLLQQQQQNTLAPVSLGLPGLPQQQERGAPLYNTNSSVATSLNVNTLPPLQANAFPASGTAEELMGSRSIFGSGNGSATTLFMAPSMGIASSAVCQARCGQPLSVCSTDDSTCSTAAPIQYINLPNGQQVLLPAATAAQRAANNILLQSHQGVVSSSSGTLAACYPLQQNMLMPQQQQQHLAPAGNCLNTATCSSSTVHSPIVTVPQQLPYATQEQQQQQLYGVPSSSIVTIGSPQARLASMQQQLQASPVQLPISTTGLVAANTSDAAALTRRLQNCSINQQWW